MLLGFLSALGIAGNLANDYKNHNKKVLGTDKDIFKDNPMVQRNAQACEDIYERARREYEARTGKKADW
jgi:hypothetical protein